MILRRTLRFTAVFAHCALLALATTPAAAADVPKTMRVALPNSETSFDPAFASDANSDAIIANVFDAMLDYDYLARPVKLVARALEAVPVAEEGGRLFVCKVLRGIMFTPDAAFAGKPRELTAADYAFTLKRLLDPVVRSPWSWLLEGKLVGGDEAQQRAKKTGKFDYDAPLPGLEVLDRYTLRIRLKEPDLRFLYALAVPSTGAVAREVVAAYGIDIGAHPVGTGPYLLGEYQRSAKIQLLANPGFRTVTYAPSGPIPAASQSVASALKGKRLPLVPRIDIAIIEEDQARWLAFLNRELDSLDIMPIQFTEQALQDGKLLPALAARGIRHQVLLRPNVYFTYFDMDHPVVGGYTPEKIALRRAISMGFNAEEQVRVLLKGRAVLANGPIPPDIAGFDPKLVTQAQRYDPAAARALLDKFGYKDTNGDGFRETPEGKPLVIERWSPPDSFYRQTDVLWKKNMDAIGIRMEIRNDKTPELRKMARLGKIPTRSDGWQADYPDAENFMQLLYGPFAGQANDSRFNLPEFNRLYDEARRLPDSSQRTQLFDRMTELMLAYAPWRMTYSRLEDALEHPWVRYHVPHPIRGQVWMFTDIDETLRASTR